jgi:hypothetical protein
MQIMNALSDAYVAKINPAITTLPTVKRVCNDSTITLTVANDSKRT